MQVQGTRWDHMVGQALRPYGTRWDDMARAEMIWHALRWYGRARAETIWHALRSYGTRWGDMASFFIWRLRVSPSCTPYACSFCTDFSKCREPVTTCWLCALPALPGVQFAWSCIPWAHLAHSQNACQALSNAHITGNQRPPHQNVRSHLKELRQRPKAAAGSSPPANPLHLLWPQTARAPLWALSRTVARVALPQTAVPLQWPPAQKALMQAAARQAAQVAWFLGQIDWGLRWVLSARRGDGRALHQKRCYLLIVSEVMGGLQPRQLDSMVNRKYEGWHGQKPPSPCQSCWPEKQYDQGMQVWAVSLQLKSLKLSRALANTHDHIQTNTLCLSSSSSSSSSSNKSSAILVQLQQLHAIAWSL